MRAKERREFVREQIEMILRSSDGERHEVIIKAGRPDAGDRRFVETIAAAMRRRGMSTSPRDVLPVPRPDLDSRPSANRPRGTRGAYQVRAARSRSLAAQAAGQMPSTSRESLRQSSLLALEPILGSRTLAESRPVKRGSRSQAAPRTFWTSGSLLVELDTQDLQNLIDDDAMNSVEGVFLNRTLRVPPMVMPKSVPSAIEDNKVSSWGVRTIGALAAWGAFECRGEGVRVALLDTGVDANHPDLIGKIEGWIEFDSKGKPKNTKPHDDDGHGTHCAGIIAGGRASGRWIGVAPAARILAARVLDGKAGGTDAQVLAGIDWAIEQGVDVINMSLGGLIWGPDVPSTYTSAILNALRVGIPVVTAIGNDGSQTSGSPGNDFFAFAVGATDHRGCAAGFSGGRTQVVRRSPFFDADSLPLVYSKPDLSAPGVAVLSSLPKGRWEHMNGTSMAAPHVSGAIALLLSATKIRELIEPAERAFVIQDLLTGSAEEYGEAGQDHRFGFGRLDVLRAIGFALDLGY